MSNSPAVIHLLAGVTAAGKSAFSIELAEEMGAGILSCDSIAVYQGMDIGSAKPSTDTRKRVVHFGIDLVDVKTVFSIADYKEYSTKIIQDISAKKPRVLVTGGSGFYLQSFLSPVVDQVDVTPLIRQKVESIYTERQISGILDELKKLNPEGLGELDVLNPRRVMRGLERCIASGKSILELKKEFERLPVPFAEFEKKMIWLDRENTDLEKRILDRTQVMLSDGLVEEVENLLMMGIERNSPACNSVGYRECIAFLKGEMKEDELPAAINHSTRRLVSKQRKWFRKHLGLDARIVLRDGGEMCDPKKWNWARFT
ncbi:tRNA (adenosine(37)-N6)-dimethylallyltransferase MiaA [Opitutales bacterium]|nr:tRNA (adenosine(37)-N6)-dimethylallyltransferase MiaA [Opitutales bacterium]